MLLSGVTAALVAPRYWWLAVIGIFLGERFYAFAMLPETRDWLLFGLVINVIVPTWLPAAVGVGVVFLVDRLRSGRDVR